MKYIRKTWGSWNDEAVLTKAMLWAFNKRTFDVSRKFEDYVKSVAETSLGDSQLSDIVKQYPAILDMPELKSTLNDLSESVRTTLRNVSEAYRTIRHAPVPDTAIVDFIRIAKMPDKESIIDQIERIINGSKSDESDGESDAENEPTCELLGMLKAFKPNRKTNPKSSRITRVVWLEERQTTNDNSAMDEIESYTVDDLDFLAEQSAYFRSTREQERALKFLMSAYNTGHKDWVYYVRPRVDHDPDPMTKLYRLGHSLVRGNRKT
jgi:hypothetical protein